MRKPVILFILGLFAISCNDDELPKSKNDLDFHLKTANQILTSKKGEVLNIAASKIRPELEKKFGQLDEARSLAEQISPEEIEILANEIAISSANEVLRSNGADIEFEWVEMEKHPIFGELDRTALSENPELLQQAIFGNADIDSESEFVLNFVNETSRLGEELELENILAIIDDNSHLLPDGDAEVLKNAISAQASFDLGPIDVDGGRIMNCQYPPCPGDPLTKREMADILINAGYAGLAAAPGWGAWGSVAGPEGTVILAISGFVYGWSLAVYAQIIQREINSYLINRWSEGSGTAGGGGGGGGWGGCATYGCTDDEKFGEGYSTPKLADSK